MAGKWDWLGSVAKFAKDAGLTAHAMGAAGLLDRLAESSACVEVMAVAMAGADDEVWKRLSDADAKIYRDMARAAAKAQAKWYRNEVETRLKNAVAREIGE